MNIQYILHTHTYIMKWIYVFLLLVILLSCRQPDYPSIAQSSLSQELIATKADSGLVILLKDNEVVAQINLIWEDGVYKEGNAQTFQIKRDMGTLLSPAYLMAASESITLSDTVDVGNGIYIKNGIQIEDHNANRGGYGVINAEQVIAFDSKIGLVKLLERTQGINEKISSLGIQDFQATPLSLVTYFDRIAHEDTTLYSPEQMKGIRKALRMVVTSGTGKNLDLENLEVSGKTGKADKNEISCCAYFEMDGSIYTCLVIISNPKEGYPSGGMMCGEVIKGVWKGWTNIMPNDN